MSVSDERPAPRRSVTLTVIAGIVGLVALLVLATAGSALWADQTQRDDDGYYTGSAHRIADGSYAVSHHLGDVNHLPGSVDGGKLVRIRISATSETDTPVFVGLARTSDADAYLAGIAHAELTEFGKTSRADYELIPGTGRPQPPAAQPIWAASASGVRSATLTWRLHEGDWSVVLMNADGSKGVAARVEAGVNVGYLGWLATGLFLFGGVLAALAVLLAVTGAGGGTGAALAPAPREANGAYPVAVAATLDEPLSRWLWLVKWLLLIPHVIVLALLWIAFVVTTVVAWVAMLATGRYPRGIFTFNLGVLRWTWRVSYYGYSALGTDKYPPFSLDREPGYPATLDIAYPGDQPRRSVLLRLVLALPHLLIVGVFVSGASYWIEDANGWQFTSPWSGLIGLLVVIAGVVVAVTGRYPRGLFDFVVGLDRWVIRVVAYAALLTAEYPPFRFDGGGEEPQAVAPAHAVPVG
jgi:hypothetical protein